MPNKQQIRITLRGYEHRMLDTSAAEIVATAKRTGAEAKQKRLSACKKR